MMRKVFLLLMPILLAEPAAAQGWWWDDEPGYRPPPRYQVVPYGSYRTPSRTYQPSYRQPTPWNDDDDEPRRPRSDDRMPPIVDGGPRPYIERIGPERIAFESRYPAGTVIIDTRGRQLILQQGGGTALRYPISVGREGFTWTGEQKISRIADWPDWHPPAEMRERDPRLPEKMTGGLRNPLGARALYLGNTLYRIHGTNDVKSIGRAQSSGCFRMLNGQVVDLSSRVGVGTRVVVVHSLSAVR